MLFILGDRIKSAKAEALDACEVDTAISDHQHFYFEHDGRLIGLGPDEKWTWPCGSCPKA